MLGFYFADTVISTAFVAAAMASLGPRTPFLSFFVAGVLMAVAVLCRIDALLALPMVALIAPMQRSTVRHASLAAMSFLFGFLPVTALAALKMGFTIADSIAVAQVFKPPTLMLLEGLFQGIYFFGLIVPPLLVIGALRELRPLHHWRSWFGYDLRRLWRFGLLILYPTVLLAYAAFAASEMRYLFPFLMPLIALHGAEGIEQVLRALRERGSHFTAALVGTGAAAAVFFAPPLLIQVRDGPSALTGYAWTPLLWDRWQRLQERTFAQVDAIVSDMAKRRRTLLISTTWNEDYYMRLRLMEAGFRSFETASAFPGCQGFATYRRGVSEVIHIRLYPQYSRSPLNFWDHAALLLTTAHACPAVRGPRDIWLLTLHPHIASILNSKGFRSLRFEGPLEVPVAADPLGERIPWPGDAQMRTLRVMRINQADLATLASQGDRIIAQQYGQLSHEKRAEILKEIQEFNKSLPVLGSR